ncbi:MULTISPECIES: hypothetical protein [Aequorivita]|nr:MULTISPECIES: hypothetical protein [Aequorivita]
MGTEEIEIENENEIETEVEVEVEKERTLPDLIQLRAPSPSKYFK